jgi:hypothetical protein
VLPAVPDALKPAPNRLYAAERPSLDEPGIGLELGVLRKEVDYRFGIAATPRLLREPDDLDVLPRQRLLP